MKDHSFEASGRLWAFSEDSGEPGATRWDIKGKSGAKMLAYKIGK